LSSNNKKIIFQNPDTLDTFEISVSDNILLRDVANQIIKKFHLKSPPIFFTLFKDNPTQNTFLDEDISLNEIYIKRLDNTIPVWWRTPDLDDNIIYELRTDRFKKSGYKLDLISKKRILIAGIGLIGSEIALNCATIGFKKLILIDYGSVDWYNIYRQPLYNKNDVFKKKSEIAKLKLESFGNIDVESLSIEIPNFQSLNSDRETIINNLEILENIVKKSDVIITSLDTFSARMILQIFSLIHQKLFINTAAGLIGGVIQIVRPNTDPCIGCGTFYDRDQEIVACTLASFGTPKIIAGLCIDILLDLIESRTVNFNYLKFNPNYTLEKKKFYKTDDCFFCGNNGLYLKYKNNNKKALIDWLFNKQ